MEFIIDNQLWFIIGGVVLLMAFIGFIAEKTDFGRKEFEKKIKPVKEKKVKEEKVKEEKVEEPKIVEELFPVQPEVEMVEELLEEPELELIEENVNEEVSTSNGDSWGEVFPVETEEDLTVPLMEEAVEAVAVEEDLTVPLEVNVETEEPVFEEEVAEEIFSEVAEQVEEPSFEEEKVDIEPIDIPETITEEKKELEIELPEIETLNEEPEDDVWKF